jgi:hypothetical protein
LGPKTGKNQRVLFTDEYMGVISKLFIAFRLLEKLPLQLGVLEGEGGGYPSEFKPFTSLTAHSLISIVQPERVIFCKLAWYRVSVMRTTSIPP